MKLLYIGSYCDTEIFNELNARKNPFFIAQYSYEYALCQEFLKTQDIEIDFVTLYQVKYWPNERLFCYFPKKRDDMCDVLGFINIPFLREISYSISTIAKIIKWAIKNRNIKCKCVYSSMHFTPVSIAVVMVTKLFNIKRCITFTDLSLFTYSEERIKIMPLYKRAIIRPYIAVTNLLQQSYDGYVLFTEKMTNVVNSYKKPYCVIEGIYNNHGIDLSKTTEKCDAIAYAGTLSSLVGVRNIIDVYKCMHSSSKLWLMGGGDMEKEIRCLSQENPKVEFFGFLTRKEVFERLKRARLLVILRNADDEYTWYSFPSKLFEYMASGTPVFTTYLQGIPEEYYSYLYSTKEVKIEKIAQEIMGVLNKSDQELFEMGQRAKKFILEQKNAVIQSKKIKEFLDTLLS